jgi:membrane protease YdiL (CAAX protease family)
MSEIATLGVIRDLVAVCLLAVFLALPVYAYVRRRPYTSWNFEGNVLARRYDLPDGIAALFLVGVLFLPLAIDRPAVHAVSEASKVPPENVVLAGTVFMLLIVFGVLSYLRIVRGLDPVELFGLRQISVRSAFFIALAAIFVAYLVIFAVKWFVEQKIYGGNFPDTSSQETVQSFENGSLSFRLIMGVAAVIIAPVVEETLFRGFLYGIGKRFTDRWFSAIVVSFLFAAMHQHVGSLVPLFVLAFSFTLAYEATGSLLVPIFMHSLFNALNIALLGAASPE